MMAMSNKKETIANNLKVLAEQVDQKMRMAWALDNEVSLSSINKYFAGEVGSKVVGEKLYNDMVKMLKAKKSLAA